MCVPRRSSVRPLTVFIACVWKGAKHITSYAVVADTTVHDNKSTALAREVLLAAEIEGSTKRHHPRATMLHLSPCRFSSGDLTAVIYLNGSGRKFSTVDPKEWLVDKVDILRVTGAAFVR